MYNDNRAGYSKMDGNAMMTWRILARFTIIPVFGDMGRFLDVLDADSDADCGMSMTSRSDSLSELLTSKNHKRNATADQRDELESRCETWLVSVFCDRHIRFSH